MSVANDVKTAGVDKLHTIIRFIQDPTKERDPNADQVEDIDAYVGDWIARGFRLASTHYLGQNANGFGIMFVLVNDA